MCVILMPSSKISSACNPQKKLWILYTQHVTTNNLDSLVPKFILQHKILEFCLSIALLTIDCKELLQDAIFEISINYRIARAYISPILKRKGKLHHIICWSMDLLITFALELII